MLFYLSILLCLVSGNVQLEVEALNELMRTVNSTDPTSNFSRWNVVNNETHCLLHGVSCMNNSIVALNLTGNGLVGKIPSSLFRLPNLITLSFASNALTDLFSIESVGKVSTLSIKDNCFTGVVPETLLNIDNLYLDCNLWDFCQCDTTCYNSTKCKKMPHEWTPTKPPTPTNELRTKTPSPIPIESIEPSTTQEDIKSATPIGCTDVDTPQPISFILLDYNYSFDVLDIEPVDAIGCIYVNGSLTIESNDMILEDQTDQIIFISDAKCGEINLVVNVPNSKCYVGKVEDNIHSLGEAILSFEYNCSLASWKIGVISAGIILACSISVIVVLIVRRYYWKKCNAKPWKRWKFDDQKQ